MSVQIVSSDQQSALDLMMRGRRPLVNEQGQMVVNQAGFPMVQRHDNGLQVYSLLRKDEWELLDAAVVRMAKLRLGGIQDLRDRGLVQSLGSLGTMVSQWNVASEKPNATVSMDGRTRGNRDRVDKKLYGVPVPIIHDSYEIGARELEASRRLGNTLDTVEAEESAASVAETLEGMLFNGNTSVNVGGSTIYGYTTLPARSTDTAANYGGGDWGTIGNIVPTVLGMISAMAAKRYYGPFGLYVAATQYIQALSFYTDGSGQSAVQRLLQLPQIAFVKPSDMLTAANGVMVQMTSNVVDYAEAMGLTNRDWTSPDGSALNFKVMLAGVPRLKTDYAGNAGICHVTAI